MLSSRIFRSLFIRTQSTPNPAFLQFFPGVPLLSEGTLDFAAPRQAQSYPLAIKLFQIEGVTRVFFSKDYVSVGKSTKSEWSVLKPLIFETLMVHLSSGEAMLSAVEPNEDTKILESDSKDLALVKEIIEFRIRPFVKDDGGDVRLVRFEEDTGKVLLEMIGSCSGCPSSGVTLKNGIEKMLTYYVKSVKVVEAVDN